jgi:DNA-binding HxlR family transcriptional regulator
MKRTSLKGNACPVARALDSIGDWWSLLIIRDAFDGMRRFGEFQKSLGVAKNILTDRLRRLVADGILELVASSDGRAYQEYALTTKGQGLFPIIVGLRQWGESYFFGSRERHSVLLDRVTNRPVRRIEVVSRDGKVLKPADTFVRKVGQRE